MVFLSLPINVKKGTRYLSSTVSNQMAHNIVAIHFLDLPVDMMAKVRLYENDTFVIYRFSEMHLY